MSKSNTLLHSQEHAPVATGENRPADLSHTVRPVYDVTESTEAYGVTVELPGVAKEAVEITAGETEVRVIGRRRWKPPSGWTALHRESVDEAFELSLAHDNAIDSDKIVAELKDGLLRLSLPKHAAVKPRRISVS